MSLGVAACIADPWNGSGTTTTFANKLGYSSAGCDLNPVMVIASKAMVICRSELTSLAPLAHDIVNKAKRFSKAGDNDNDPLESWFAPSGARYVRLIERAVQQLLIDTEKRVWLTDNDSVNALSSITCFFYLALFRTMRRLLSRYYASNPTWVKIPDPACRVRPSMASILAIFEEEVVWMVDAAKGEAGCTGELNQRNNSVLQVASSAQMPFEASMADLVVTSPPYCTRIDYAVATLPELALLGYHFDTEFDVLRRALIGSSTVPRKAPMANELWGNACYRFLDGVLHHESKASASYYYKNHVQYFGSMFESIGEVGRILKPAGHCVMVVQDSYYKNIHNDLARTFTEMFAHYGLELVSRKDFISNRNMARINPGVSKYRAPKEPVESVLCFRK